MLGLYAFFYGVVHLSSYVSFDHVFDVAEILKDIVKRPVHHRRVHRAACS